MAAHPTSAIGAVLVSAVCALTTLACGSGDDSETDRKVGKALRQLEASVQGGEARGGTDSSATPEGTVRNYFLMLNRGDYDEAWTTLAPAVQEQFGGFEHWVGGYETTKSTTVTSVDVATASNDSADLRVAIRAVDAGPCGEALVRNFEGPWSLEKDGPRWVVVAADFAQTSSSSAPCPGA